jgi:hypothetical protein
MAVRITPENIVSEDNVTDISGIAVGTTRTRAHAREDRPSLQCKQPRHVLAAGEFGLQRFPRFPNEPLTQSPILSPSNAPPIPAMQAGTSMRMSASTTSFSFGSSGVSSRSGAAGHAQARGRGATVSIRATPVRPAVTVTNVSGENAFVEAEWGTSRSPSARTTMGRRPAGSSVSPRRHRRWPRASG